MTTFSEGALPTVEVTLRDGSAAEIRPIQPGDRSLIEEGLAHMSLQSRVARFGSGIAHLSESELDYLTEIDLVDHVAWGATIEDVPAGTGRYIRPAGGDEGEVAVAVVDEFQQRGLGRTLFDALVSSARHNGVGELYFSVYPANEIVLRMMRGVGARLDDSEGLIVGHFRAADVPPGPNHSEFVELLKRYQTAL